MDTIFGRIDELIPREALEFYDLYTSSFGDTYRYYMRGQLTIMRNRPDINTLWKHCEHLSNFNDRLVRYFSPPPNPFRGRWEFQSAEGCFSRIVADHPNVSIYVAAGQHSDAYNAPVSEKESFTLGHAVLRCYAHSPDWAQEYTPPNRRREVLDFVLRRPGGGGVREAVGWINLSYLYQPPYRDLVLYSYSVGSNVSFSPRRCSPGNASGLDRQVIRLAHDCHGPRRTPLAPSAHSHCEP